MLGAAGVASSAGGVVGTTGAGAGTGPAPALPGNCPTGTSGLLATVVPCAGPAAAAAFPLNPSPCAPDAVAPLRAAAAR